MDIIYFENEEEFEQNTQYYSEGFESKLYRYTYDGRELLIKKYYDLDQVNLDKIQEISMLKTEGLLKPTHMVEIGNSISPFAMDFKRGFYPLSNQKYYLNDMQKYNLIMDLKEILLSLRNENATYGDLNPANIITDGEQTYLCDSVNLKIGDFGFDEISSTMHQYIKRTGTSEGLDFYMLNLLTIYLFNNIKYENITEEIELAVMNFFNKQPYEYIIGATDSEEQLNMCCDIFLSDKVCEELLIDNIAKYIGFPNIENIRVK